ncbi:hypothetical protein LX36DRAFT_654433 [Colletotrichum falcatum]|nr:hypothetical protein LX36DRAFT_654433 [Colletotrichum falcatum]
MLFSDQCQRWTEELYASARDLIYGSARQSAAWRECSKFDWLWPEDNDLLSQFELAYKTLEKGDFPMYGAMIRQAFRTVDTIVEEESCIIVRKLLLDIPWVLSYDDRDKELLQVYLRHVYQMLIAKKPREPIGAMAKTMHAILLESPAQFSHLLEQLHSAIADYFTATGGCDDLISLCARQDALVIRSDNEVTPSEVESILESFSNLSDEAIGLFGEDSPTAVEIECKRITTMQHLRYWNSFEHLCESLIRRLQATNGILWDDWDPSDLDDVAFTLRSLAKFYDHTDNFDRYILCLRECICMLNYIAEEYGNLWGCGARAVQYGMELMEALTEHDRLQEASQVRLDVAGSKYLREVMENDLECKSLEI